MNFLGERFESKAITECFRELWKWEDTGWFDFSSECSVAC